MGTTSTKSLGLKAGPKQLLVLILLSGLGLVNSQDSRVILHKDLHFLREPTDVDVVPGGSVLFYCRASGGTGTPKIHWIKNGAVLDVDANARYIQLSDGSLMISNAAAEDVGVYECVASSSSTEIKSRPARVRYYRPRTRPIIIYSPIQAEVKKGDTIVLNCGASGFPEPTYEWFRDGGRLSSAHPRYSVERNGSLIITNAQLDDTAHYRCSASNYLGKASSSARVKVNLALPEAKPKFTTSPRSATAKENGIVEFTCVAIGHPYPDISWWNNNRLVNSDGRITVSNGGQHLRIPDLRPYDSGNFTCRAENRLGRAEVTVSLSVEVQQVPLSFAISPHDHSAKIGTTVQFPCRAEGYPTPQLSWNKDGSDVRFEKRYRPSPDGSLVIYNVTQQDSGLFECVADNGKEKQTAEARLTILSEASINDPVTSPLTSSSLLYQVNSPSAGDNYVLVSLEEAKASVNRALNATVARLDSLNATTAIPELILKFRYPPATERELARAAEIYERTLQLVAQKVASQTPALDRSGNFSYTDLISPTYLELLANLSGCEAHRSRKDADCKDMCFHAKYRTIDGTCNNLQNSLWGASLTAFIRNLPSQYENGFNTPIGWEANRLYNGFKKPSARKVSTALISTSKITPDPSLTHMVMQWGQFLDHDLDHAMEAISRETFENGITCGATCDFAAPCFPIDIPDGDPRITSRKCMEFTRSSAACGSGSTSIFFDRIQPREQLNRLTSFIDASQVYGSQDDLAISLRNLTNDFGRLREGPSNLYSKPLLPFNDRHEIDCRRDPRESGIGCFLAGDVRANEQLGLLSMHTLWFREHNRLVSELRDLNPSWTSDQLYEETRKIVGAQMQHITFQHWLPLIIGKEGMKMLGPYSGYDASIDPSISNEFASAAFRFGHSLINPQLKRLTADMEEIPEGNLRLHEAFFSPWRLVQEGGIDPILRGLFDTPAKMNVPGEVMNDELTENLFEAAHEVALDLAALNIQRGRDHGLAPYTQWRRWCGLHTAQPNVIRWEDLKADIKSEAVLDKLKALYGHPDNVDLWVGGLLERPIDGAKVGPTFRCILLDQFYRLRSGDRFWYENPSTLKPEQLSQIKQTSLARILCDNADDIKSVPENVFMMQSKTFTDCALIPKMSLHPWFECQEEQKSSNEEGSVRNRRSENGDAPSEEKDLTENRIEGVEEILRQNRDELQKVRRKLHRIQLRLHQDKSHRSSASLVCIDHTGHLRSQKEKWLHQSPSGQCASCLCKGSEAICQLTDCP